jgi:hypothetical protein
MKDTGFRQDKSIRYVERRKWAFLVVSLAAIEAIEVTRMRHSIYHSAMLINFASFLNCYKHGTSSTITYETTLVRYCRTPATASLPVLQRIHKMQHTPATASLPVLQRVHKMQH